MSSAEMTCPKCDGQMEQGFIIDQTQGGRLVSQWAAGVPQRSIWLGLKSPNEPTISIGVFRCAACGFLEHYAREEFTAQ